MNSLLLRSLYCLLSMILGTSTVLNAQTMPQDSWRMVKDNVASPTSGNTLRCVGVGSGGVYAGEVVAGSGSSGAYRILQFDHDCNFVRRFDTIFTDILGIVCSDAGEVFVLDRWHSRVKVFSPDGNFLRQWGAPGTGSGEFGLMNASGVNMLAFGPDGNLYVCDPGNNRVQIFSKSGEFLRKWGETGNLPGQFSANQPMAIGISGDGNVFLPGKIFSLQGAFSRAFGNMVSISTSDDGMVVYADGPFWYNWGGYYNTYAATSEGDSGAQISNFSAPAYGICFSKSGDLYTIPNGKLTKFVREYRSSANFINPTPLPQAFIKSAAQRAGTSLVDVTYRVTDTDSPTVSTGLLAFRDGRQDLFSCVSMRTFMEDTAGAVGPNQPVDTDRQVVWNMAADWQVDYANIRVEVLAKDERNPLGIHWITVPASGDDPAIQVSNRPQTNQDFKDLWYWFLATGQDVRLSNGAVIATSGAYNGHTLAICYGAGQEDYTTWAGRMFVSRKIGSRPITQDELTRARAGLYGFSSLSADSLVKDSSIPTSYIKSRGSNSYGEGNLQSFTGANPVKISSGGSHTLFLKSDGTLWAYGLNNCGQLGTGNNDTPIGPVRVATGVAQIAAGGSHSAFIKTDGTLWCMGYNGNGELGNASTTSSNVPVQVASEVENVAAGGNHTVFSKKDGSLWVTGYNGYGQLGNGNHGSVTSPVQISEITGVVQVACGQNHTLFVKNDGSLWAMGYNSYGQLGVGDWNGSYNLPTQVPGAADVSFVATGGNHSLYLKNDGSLWAMGNNDYGQLGTGNNDRVNIPVPVTTGVIGVSAGDSFSLFSKTDGSLWGMGYNGYGQLNDGTTNNRNAPILVEPVVNAFDAGWNFFNAIQLATP